MSCLKVLFILHTETQNKHPNDESIFSEINTEYRFRSIFYCEKRVGPVPQYFENVPCPPTIPVVDLEQGCATFSVGRP